MGGVSLRAALLALMLPVAGSIHAADIDFGVGPFGLNWGAPLAEVRKAYPPAGPETGQDPGTLVYSGDLRVGAASVPGAAVGFRFDERARLRAVVVMADAAPAVTLRDALAAALGTPRHAVSKYGPSQLQVFEWSTARYGVRLQFASDDAAGSRGPTGVMQFEVQQEPLQRSQVDAVHQAQARRAESEQRRAVEALAERNARERTRAEESLAARQGLTPEQAAQCTFPGVVLPPDFALFVAGGYRGVAQDFQIDDSGSEAGLYRVEVNYTEKPVVLMLGAYNPTVWDLRWTAGTRLVAVVLSGYHRQEIVGLPRNVPRLTTTRANLGACGYFYPGEDGEEFINPLARRLFGRPADLVWPATGGRILVGDPIPAGSKLVSAPGPRIDSFADPSKLPAGPAGIAAAVTRGDLRPATAADIEAWRRAALAQQPPDVPPVAGAKGPRVPMPLSDRSYVVLRSFDVPPALSGGYAVNFILPAGVPPPRGHLGHSAIFDMGTGQCTGVTCGMH